jgi:hypothetical protein
VSVSLKPEYLGGFLPIANNYFRHFNGCVHVSNLGRLAAAQALDLDGHVEPSAHIAGRQRGGVEGGESADQVLDEQHGNGGMTLRHLEDCFSLGLAEDAVLVVVPCERSFGPPPANR